MEGCIGSRVRNIRRRESFFPLIRFVPGSCFGCLLLTSPPARVAEVDSDCAEVWRECRRDYRSHNQAAFRRHSRHNLRSPRPPAPRAPRRLTPLQVDFSQDVTVTAIHLFTSKFHVRPRRGQCRLTSSRF